MALALTFLLAFGGYAFEQGLQSVSAIEFGIGQWHKNRQQSGAYSRQIGCSRGSILFCVNEPAVEGRGFSGLCGPNVIKTTILVRTNWHPVSCPDMKAMRQIKNILLWDFGKIWGIGSVKIFKVGSASDNRARCCSCIDDAKVGFEGLLIGRDGIHEIGSRKDRFQFRAMGCEKLIAREDALISGRIGGFFGRIGGGLGMSEARTDQPQLPPEQTNCPRATTNSARVAMTSAPVKSARLSVLVRQSPSIRFFAGLTLCLVGILFGLWGGENFYRERFFIGAALMGVAVCAGKAFLGLYWWSPGRASSWIEIRCIPTQAETTLIKARWLLFRLSIP